MVMSMVGVDMCLCCFRCSEDEYFMDGKSYELIPQGDVLLIMDGDGRKETATRS